jgi:hypothetical protein
VELIFDRLCAAEEERQQQERLQAQAEAEAEAAERAAVKARSAQKVAEEQAVGLNAQSFQICGLLV